MNKDTSEKTVEIQKKGKKYYLMLIVTAFFAMLPFWVSFLRVEEEGLPMYYKPVIETWGHIALEKSLFIYIGVILFFIWSERFCRALSTAEKRVAAGISVFYALCVHIGASINNTDATLDYFFSTILTFIVSTALIVGYSLLFYRALCAAIWFADNFEKIISGSKSAARFGAKADGFLKNKTFLKLWCGLIICWLPYMVINYPATVHADSGRMLSHFMNDALNNHDPIMQTLFLGYFYKFFRDLTNSPNIAIFLFSALQSLYCSAIFAMFYKHLYKERKTPPQILLPVYFITAVLPMFTRNSATVCKDSNYAIYVVFFVMLVIMYDCCKAKDLKKLLPLLFLDYLLVMFSRKNGLHLTIISSVVFFAYLVFTNREDKFIALLLVFCAAIFIHAAVENAVITKYDLEGTDNDTRESSSVFFQQTARYVRDHSDIISQEEIDAIDAVLDYNAIGDLYEAKRSDPVKETYRKEATKEDYNNYLKAWAKGLFKAPGCYIQATLGNISGYFYPDDYGYYSDLYFVSNPFTDEIKPPQKLYEIAEKLRIMDCDSHNIPVIGLFSSVGFYIWLDIFMLIFFIFKKRYSLLVYNMPAAVTILICMASPINNTVRYALPAIFVIPFIFCTYFGKDYVPSRKKEKRSKTG